MGQEGIHEFTLERIVDNSRTQGSYSFRVRLYGHAERVDNCEPMLHLSKSEILAYLRRENRDPQQMELFRRHKLGDGRKTNRPIGTCRKKIMAKT